MKRLVLLALVLAPIGLIMARPASRLEGLGLERRPELNQVRGHARHSARGRFQNSEFKRPEARAEWIEVQGLPMATKERAEQEARRELMVAVQKWLQTAGVPRTWTPPSRLLNSMVDASPVEAIPNEYGEEGFVYIQRLRLDRSDAQRDRLLTVYEKEVAGHRLVTIGGILAFALVLLGAVSGYIHADEATKGYYTRSLRLAAAVGIGGAGIVLYRLLFA